MCFKGICQRKGGVEDENYLEKRMSDVHRGEKRVAFVDGEQERKRVDTCS